MLCNNSSNRIKKRCVSCLEVTEQGQTAPGWKQGDDCAGSGREVLLCIKHLVLDQVEQLAGGSSKEPCRDV